MSSGIKKHLSIIIALFFLIFLVNIAFWLLTREENIAKNNEVSDREEMIVLDLEIDEDDFVFDVYNPAAKVDLIVYDDPLGEFSKDYFERMQDLEDRYGEEINIAYRFNDIGLYKDSGYFGRVIVCAGEQDRFYEVYREVLGMRERGVIRNPYIMGLSSVYTIDVAKWDDCMNEDRATETLNKWKQEADENSLIGVPNTLVNGVYYPGSYPLEDFVDKEGREMKGLYSIINDELQITN